MCLLLFPGFLRFSVLCALFINNSGGYLLFTAGITSFLFEFGLQLLIFMFSFRARSSWHSRSLPFGLRDDWNRVSFEQPPLFFRTTKAGRMCAWEENILLRHRSRDRARLNSTRSRFNPAASSGFNSSKCAEISECLNSKTERRSPSMGF